MEEYLHSIDSPLQALQPSAEAVQTLKSESWTLLQPESLETPGSSRDKVFSLGKEERVEAEAGLQGHLQQPANVGLFTCAAQDQYLLGETCHSSRPQAVLSQCICAAAPHPWQMPSISGDDFGFR